MDLVGEVYHLTLLLPAAESAGLSRQIRRAATSIPANIAEGNTRAHRREYLNFLSIARGSAAELATHCEIARRIGYLSEADLAPALELLERVAQMLTRLARRLST